MPAGRPARVPAVRPAGSAGAAPGNNPHSRRGRADEGQKEAMSDGAINFVSGLPRSGTSLMMQMIHAGGVTALTDLVRASDEDNPKERAPSGTPRNRSEIFEVLHGYPVHGPFPLFTPTIFTPISSAQDGHSTSPPARIPRTPG